MTARLFHPVRVFLAASALAACEGEVSSVAPSPRPSAVTRPPVAPPEPATVLRDEGCGHPIPGPLPARSRVVEHRDVAGPDPAVRGLHLTFVGDPARTVTAQWSTDEATLATEVRYRREGDAETRVARGYSFTYAGSAGRRQHRAHLCGLAPGSRYRYDAGGAGGRSLAASFVTAPDGPASVRVLVTGDSRGHPAAWRAVAARALRERPDVMVFTGDAVADGSRRALWDAFFDAAPELFASVPAYWVDGNHEGVNAVTDAQFAYPPNGTAEHHGRWWAATYGPLRLVALNDVTLPVKGVVLRAETDFLARELAAVDRRRTPWVATAHHAPMHTTSGGHLPDLATRRAWGPLLDRHRVDVDLAGHTHNYQSSLPMLSDGTLAPGGRGTRYFAFGGAGAPLYGFRGTAPWVAHQETTHGYAVLSLDARRGRWDAYRPDGSCVESVELPERGRW